MQTSLFQEKQDIFLRFPKLLKASHRGLRGVMLSCIVDFAKSKNRLPELAKRRCKGSDNDRETLLEKNREALKKWKMNSQRSTFSWCIRSVIK